MGDVKARVSLLFDQQTWNGAWSDSLIGNAADPTFNDIDYPITVTNKGAVTERCRSQPSPPSTARSLVLSCPAAVCSPRAVSVPWAIRSLCATA